VVLCHLPVTATDGGRCVSNLAALAERVGCLEDLRGVSPALLSPALQVLFSIDNKQLEAIRQARAPASPSPCNDHTGTTVVKFHGERDIFDVAGRSCYLTR